MLAPLTAVQTSSLLPALRYVWMWNCWGFVAVCTHSTLFSARTVRVAEGELELMNLVGLLRLHRVASSGSHISRCHHICANSLGFQRSSPLLSYLCPLCVPWGGGGYIQNALEKRYLEHPGSACCTDGMFEIFVLFGRCVCCLLPLFVNRQLPCLHTNSHHGLFSQSSKNIHIPPQRNDMLAHWTESSENLGKMPKPTELAHSE